MENIWLNGIMGVIVGDALGLPVQFLTREELDENPVTGMIGYGTFYLPAGSWSDDSSLTLATLESIYSNNGIDCEDIMENFADWLLDGKFTPYGKAFDQGNTCVQAIINYVKKHDIEHCGITGEYANGNGALMRIMPVCLFAYENINNGVWTEDKAINEIHKVSSLTHNHLRSKLACGIYYFMIKAILDENGDLQKRLQHGMDNALQFYRKDASNLVQLSYYGRMFRMDKFKDVPKDEIKSSGYVVDSFEAAVWSLITTDSFEDALLKSVNLGKDTDTVGAIAGGLAGLYYGYDRIPAEWLKVIQKREDIENVIRVGC